MNTIRQSVLPPLRAAAWHVVTPWSQPLYNDKMRAVTGDKLFVGWTSLITAVAIGVLSAFVVGGLASLSGWVIVPLLLSAATVPLMMFLFLTAAKGYQYRWAGQHIPLFEAAKEGNIEKIREAFKENSYLNIEYVDRHGSTPFHYICQSSSSEKQELLVELFKKKPALTLKNQEGKTPLGLLQETDMSWLRTYLLNRENLAPLWEGNEGKVPVGLGNSVEDGFVLLFIVRLEDAALQENYLAHLRTIEGVDVSSLITRVNKIYEAAKLPSPIRVEPA